MPMPLMYARHAILTFVRASLFVFLFFLTAIMSSSHPSGTLPVMPSASLSPPPVVSPTPASPIGAATTSGEETGTGKRRYNLTPSEQQALHLQRLLSKPDREVKIPKPAREKELRPPREMIKNVSGSSAGAGSGEFHVYKHSRRREYERIKLMEDKAEREKERQAYEERQKALEEQVSAKTSKNRAKREKKKNAKAAARGTAAPDKAPAPLADEGQEERGDEGKRRRINAEGAAQILFRRRGSEEQDEDEG